MSEKWWIVVNKWVALIRDPYQAYLKLKDGLPSAEADGLEFASTIELEDYAARLPVGVWVRSAWHSPGDARAADPYEYKIVLSGLCPAVHLTRVVATEGGPGSIRVEAFDAPGLFAPNVPGFEWHEWDFRNMFDDSTESNAVLSALWWFVSLFVFSDESVKDNSDRRDR